MPEFVFYIAAINTALSTHRIITSDVHTCLTLVTPTLLQSAAAAAHEILPGTYHALRT